MRQWMACRDACGGYVSSLGQRMEGRTNWKITLVKFAQQVSGWIAILRWNMSAKETWKDFLILGETKSTAFQNNQISCAALQSMLHIRDPGMTLGGVPPSLSTAPIRMLCVACRLLAPLSPDTARWKRKLEATVLSTFSYSSIFPFLISGLPLHAPFSTMQSLSKLK